MRELTLLEPPGPRLCSTWGERLPQTRLCGGWGGAAVCTGWGPAGAGGGDWGCPKPDTGEGPRPHVESERRAPGRVRGCAPAARCGRRFKGGVSAGRACCLQAVETAENIQCVCVCVCVSLRACLCVCTTPQTGACVCLCLYTCVQTCPTLQPPGL